MDPALLTAGLSAIVATGGTLFTFIGRRKESADKHIDMAFSFNQQLVDDLRTERADLRAERTQLFERLQLLERDVVALREEIEVLRRNENVHRRWALRMMRWSDDAYKQIHALGGACEQAPDPPQL